MTPPGMVSDPLTDGWYGGTRSIVDPMLIVCPNCSTYYAIEAASLGSAGRTVRCARCKTTWFADATKSEPELIAAADSTTEAEATFSGVLRPDHPVNSHIVEDEPQPADAEPGASPVTQNHPAAAEMPATITDAPPIVPTIEPSMNAGDDPDADEAENFAARRRRLQARRKQARRSSRWTALILVLFAFNVALVGARSEVVRFLPQTASLFAAVGLPVNLRNLKFENMRISKEAQEGLSSLIVERTIVSISNRAVEVPRLRFTARDVVGQEVYTWTALPGRSILGPGEKLDFRSRFVSPPETAVDVMVRFAGAQDAAPAAK